MRASRRQDQEICRQDQEIRQLDREIRRQGFVGVIGLVCVALTFGMLAFSGACVTKSDVVEDLATEEMILLRNPHPGDPAWEGRRGIALKRYDTVFPVATTAPAAVTSR